jgi:Spy/CpxP family protein refolding chaperone
MRKRIAILTLVLVTISATAFVLHAGPGKRHGHGFGHGFGGPGMHAGFNFMAHVGKLKSELDLSDAQVDQLKAIAAETHEQNKQYRKQMHGGFMAIAQKLVAEPNDVTGAQAMLEQQAAAQRAIQNNIVAAAAKGVNVLTPEQRTKMADHLAEAAARWENRGR